ncbi:MAG: hypothetical protein JW833_03780 [Prolixibacteraceae bacterium]|nr:hypothetical protein [Prolixibacteraceae bacterium]
MDRKKINILLLTVFILFMGFSLYAQQDTVLRQEVEVVKAYRPSISDAFKISDIPKMDKEEHQKPTFNYSIFSQPVFSTFSVNPLQAAKITGKPKEDHGYGLIKLGTGNYGKPYADFYLNNNNSKNTIFGVHFQHLSSHGKIKLPGNDKVDAPFSDNVAELYTKHSGQNAEFDVNVFYNRNGFNYYGYPVFQVPSQLMEENQDINYFGTKQAFSRGGLNFGIQSTSRSKQAAQLGMDIDYQYFTTKTGQKEHLAELMVHVKKPVNNIVAMIDAGGAFYLADSIFNNTLNDYGKRREIWFKANPVVQFEKKNMSLKAGGKFYFVLDKDRDPAIRVAPDVLFTLKPIEGILDFFAGIDGKYEQNNYSKIALENPFVNPEHDVKNTMHKYRFFGGFNGKFSSKMNYTVSAEYSSIKDQPFYYQEAYFYPDATQPVDPIITNNDFQVLYDDLNLTKLNLEVYYTASEKLNLLLTGSYYAYKLKEQAEAWNLPDFDVKLSLDFQVTEQLNVATDIYVIGERKGLVYEYNDYQQPPWSSVGIQKLDKAYIMDMVIDLNARATYSVTRNFSVFAQLNNFGFQNYEHWLGYPVQNFNFLGGISYSF